VGCSHSRSGGFGTGKSHPRRVSNPASTNLQLNHHNNFCALASQTNALLIIYKKSIGADMSATSFSATNIMRTGMCRFFEVE
jgi:hypothetical protein